MSVIHYSGAECPRDYYHGACDWAKTFEYYSEYFVDSYAGSEGYTFAERRILIAAIEKWQQAHDAMWSHLISAAVGTFTACPLCSSWRTDLEHAYFFCDKVKKLMETWLRSRHSSGTPSSMYLTLVHDAPRFRESLKFVARVNKERRLSCKEEVQQLQRELASLKRQLGRSDGRSDAIGAKMMKGNEVEPVNSRAGT